MEVYNLKKQNLIIALCFTGFLCVSTYLNDTSVPAPVPPSGVSSPDDAVTDDEIQTFEDISQYFAKPHDAPDSLTADADLDGDGIPETISLTSLDYNGGDGGYEVCIYRNENGSSYEVPLPDNYSAGDGFPFSTQWSEDGVSVMLGDTCIQKITRRTLDALYAEKGMEDALFFLSENQTITGDAVSGFSVSTDADGNTQLVLKTYLSGISGHSDCLGYGITKLCLNEDNTWDATYEFVLDQ